MFTEYLSYVYLFEEQENFQIMVNYERSNNPSVHELNRELKEQYFALLVQPFPSASLNFLEYHYNKYLGVKEDFLHFIKETLTPENIATYVMMGENARIITNTSTATIEDLGIRRAIDRWIDEKKTTVLKKTGVLKARQNKNSKEVKPFYQYIKDKEYTLTDNQKIEIVNFLKKEFSGKKGISIAFMILALKVRNHIEYGRGDMKFIYQSIRLVFGNIGTDSGINKYMGTDLSQPPYKNDFQQIQRKIYPFIDKVMHK